MQSLLLGGSPGAVLFGMITIGLAQGETLLTITPAFSKISNSFVPTRHVLKEEYRVFE